MTSVVGSPALSGEEAEQHCPENSFELIWAGAADLDTLNLHPAEIREPLVRILTTGDVAG
jgi:hypothetical protein